LAVNSPPSFAGRDITVALENNRLQSTSRQEPTQPASSSLAGGAGEIDAINSSAAENLRASISAFAFPARLGAAREVTDCLGPEAVVLLEMIGFGFSQSFSMGLARQPKSQRGPSRGIGPRPAHARVPLPVVTRIRCPAVRVAKFIIAAAIAIEPDGKPGQIPHFPGPPCTCRSKPSTGKNQLLRFLEWSGVALKGFRVAATRAEKGGQVLFYSAVLARWRENYRLWLFYV
jgi:hypothetical protein